MACSGTLGNLHLITLREEPWSGTLENLTFKSGTYIGSLEKMEPWGSKPQEWNKNLGEPAPVWKSCSNGDPIATRKLNPKWGCQPPLKPRLHRPGTGTPHPHFQNRTFSTRLWKLRMKPAKTSVFQAFQKLRISMFFGSPAARNRRHCSRHARKAEKKRMQWIIGIGKAKQKTQNNKNTTKKCLIYIQGP